MMMWGASLAGVLGAGVMQSMDAAFMREVSSLQVGGGGAMFVVVLCAPSGCCCSAVFGHLSALGCCA
jgi:hypothetical protein